jgi:hypothetical protein
MQIACHDKNIEKMLTIISEKKKDLHEKYSQIQTSKEENIILNDILEDYKEYYDKMKNDKIMQYNGLDQLTQYLDEIALNEEIDQDMLTKLKDDQKKILQEMVIIKNKIENLT